MESVCEVRLGGWEMANQPPENNHSRIRKIELEAVRTGAYNLWVECQYPRCIQDPRGGK